MKDTFYNNLYYRLQTYVLRLKSLTEGNSTISIDGVSCVKDSFKHTECTVLRMKLILKIPAIAKSQNGKSYFTNKL